MEVDLRSLSHCSLLHAQSALPTARGLWDALVGHYKIVIIIMSCTLAILGLGKGTA